MGTTIRRVVTGHNAEGKSCFIMDGAPPHIYQRSPGSSRVTEVWDTSATPASNQGDADPTVRDFRLPPPKNGSVFRIISYPPDSVRLAALQAEHANDTDDGSGLGRATFRHGLGTKRGFGLSIVVRRILLLIIILLFIIMCVFGHE